MNSQNNGITCSLCHSYLFEDDDVVYCPVCGAPHHRDCYNRIGHCALEELHGTDRQYDKVKRAAEQENPPKTENEKPNNDTYADSPFSGFNGVDFLGGVPADYQIDNGVTAKEARDFVLTNTMRYIPKFAKLNDKNKISWNFLAFIFPCGWFLSRKMYKHGIVTGLLTIISTLLSIPLNNTFYNLGIMDATTYPQMLTLLAENMGKISGAVLIASFIGGIFSFAIRIISALLGDYWYKSHAVSTIKEIKSSSEDIAFDFRKRGGVNLFLFFLGVLAVQYIPALIATLI